MSDAVAELGLFGVGVLLLRAYSMGAGTYTGIEAVCNAMGTLREPRVKTGKKALLYMALSLSFVAGGIILGYMLNGVEHIPGKTLNASLIEGIAGNIWQGQTKSIIVAFVLVTEATLLFVAAQTGFLGGPQVLSSMAVDSYMPHRFAHLSDRLVTKYGIYFMGIMAIVMLYITGGSVKYLVIMYSINVFLTFTVDQFGMCVHWWRDRHRERKWKRKLGLNGVGFLLTSSILSATVWIKFPEGGWITLLITGVFIALSFLVRRHYWETQEGTRRLDSLLMHLPAEERAEPRALVPQRNAPTAVILVTGYNGMGMHVFFSVARTFPGMFNNFVFLSAGIIDSSRFKGAEEVANLGSDLKDQLQNYVDFVTAHGNYAEARYEVGTDVIEIIDRLAEGVRRDFPNITIFAGKLVFREEKLFGRLLHNQTAFLVQKKLVYHGLPMLILPVRVM